MVKSSFRKSLSANLRFLLGIACIAITHFTVMAMLMRYQHTKLIKSVDGQLPGYFPVVVRTEGKAQIVWGEDLDCFRAEHPNYSFLIPADQLDLCQAQIRSNIRALQSPPSFDQSSPIPWDASFKVEVISRHRQKFEVFATWDDDRMNIGWYEATDRELFPQSQVFYFGPGLVLKYFPIAALITVAIWGLPATLWKYRRYMLPNRQ